jgi:glycosyltransferase involved in cell wall biosynthesis
MAKNTKGFQDTCVLIPCHNEEATIAEVIKQFRKTLPKSKIIVINNNSTDNTREIAKKSGALVIDEIKVGKGFAVRQGFKNAKRKIIVMVDGDLTYDPATAIRMVELVRSGADMVVAFRESFEKSTYRKGHVVGNYLFSKFQLKLLTAMRVGQKQKKININIPKLDDFIHKIYVHVARKIYKNVYLFEFS